MEPEKTTPAVGAGAEGQLEKRNALSITPAPGEIETAIANLEITIERYASGKPYLVMDRTATLEAVNILMASWAEVRPASYAPPEEVA